MRRFSIVNQGYNIEEVNHFIDIVIKKLEKLSEENTNYLSQLETLKKQSNQNNQNLDTRVASAIVAAQEASDRMKQLAQEEAELIVREAKDNASAIVNEALVHAQRVEQEYEVLKKKCRVYQTKMESLARAQLELCQSDEEE